MIKKTASARLPTKYGMFCMNVYTCEIGCEHVALIKGKVQNPMLVRLHSSCVTGDIFSSLKCDCGEQVSLEVKPNTVNRDYLSIKKKKMSHVLQYV